VSTSDIARASSEPIDDLPFARADSNELSRPPPRPQKALAQDAGPLGHVLYTGE